MRTTRSRLLLVSLFCGFTGVAVADAGPIETKPKRSGGEGGAATAVPAVAESTKRKNEAAKAEIEALVRALKAYDAEYSKNLIVEKGDAGKDSVESESEAKMMAILLAKGFQGFEAKWLNPREKVFYEGKPSEKGKGGLQQSEIPGAGPRLVDPWGRPYRVIVDGDYNHEVVSPAGGKIRASFAVYSLGADGEFDEKDPRSWE